MPSGDPENPAGVDQALRRIGAELRRIGDAIAGLQVRDALAHRLDHARGFAAEDGRKSVGNLVEAAPVVGVEEIQADRLMPDAGLSRAGRADFHILEAERVGPAIGMDPHSLRHHAYSRS